MTDTEIRVAIAEECGLMIKDVPFTPALVNPHDGWRFTDAAFYEYRKAYPSGCIPMKIPDYLNDLNAMHEAEETLQPKGIYPEHYAAKIMEITPRRKTTVSGQRVSHMSHYFDLIHATARIRAEAFLRVKGRWKE